MKKDYDDLIWRLRHGTGLPVLQGLMNEAAHAIEELQAELLELKMKTCCCCEEKKE